jgi:hypothetical protein
VAGAPLNNRAANRPTTSPATFHTASYSAAVRPDVHNCATCRPTANAPPLASTNRLPKRERRSASAPLAPIGTNSATLPRMSLRDTCAGTVNSTRQG